jgi:hypothetical protein
VIGFVHINKTAGSSVKFVLRSSFGIQHCDVVTRNPDGVFSNDELRFARRMIPGLRSISGHPLRHPSAHLRGDLVYFSFVRDPVQRAASQFQQIQRGDWTRRRKYREAGAQKKPSLEEFAASPRWRNLQTLRIAGVEDVDRARAEIERHYFFMGLTERFQESMRLLLQVCPYPLDPRYRRLKVAPDNDLKQRILEDPGSRRLLEEANRVDPELYAWVRDVFHPAQHERAGELTHPGPVEIGETPWRYQACRAFNNAVYKQAVKLRGTRSG